MTTLVSCNVLYCNKCSKVALKEIKVGLKAPCVCGGVITVYDNLIFIKNLIQLSRKYKSKVADLQSTRSRNNTNNNSKPVDYIKQLSSTSFFQDNSLTSVKQHEPMLKYLTKFSKNIKFNYDSVDFSDYYDELAMIIGKEFNIYGRLVEHLKHASNDKADIRRISLSRISKNQAVQTKNLEFLKLLYKIYFISHLNYLKDKQLAIVTVQKAINVRKFFAVDWLEWYVCRVTCEICLKVNITFSIARNVEIETKNGKNELDIALCINNQLILIECKTGEFRMDIDKYQRLFKILHVSKENTIILYTTIDNNNTLNLSKTFNLPFLHLSNFQEEIKRIILTVSGYSKNIQVQKSKGLFSIF